MNENILNMIVKLKSNKALDKKHMRMFCNLSIAEYKGIMAQKTGEEMTCQEMARVMDLSPSRSSRVIDNLVQKGYFIRKTSSYDRRTIAITLSSKGKKIKEEIKKNRQQMEQEIVEKFSDDEVEMIRNSLRMLLNYFM
ncbi:MAG: MarR family transcriptional regulator [Candidatus Caldatribacteriota bacterium]|nr:MarR family transcriptional regulator [Atribacterota bacterium]MDD3030847.1 MarR family transcriptional regulator [Atribacterota bacterium]MDD4288255.1 MarR family transcriptional regulator [Atribacterota bacterium]MDD4764890.1 MarR family transcriptional regulator [Atribacterota bacterium]MDD5635622.1 MarR family transcriptional regulator [Atribacterota bacterium]